MKLLKKNMVLFLACSLLFLVACSSNIDEPVAIDEGETSITEVESLPLVIHSVQDLQDAIETISCMKRI